MSVIMAYKTKDKIYLGADNRTVREDDVISRNNVNKIVVVNNDVAVAFAGCYKSQMLFNFVIKRMKNVSDFRAEDALKAIRWVYRLCKLLRFNTFSKEILSIGSQFLVVGKNKKNECCIYMTLISEGKLRKPLLKEWFIFPPCGADMDVCSNILKTNVAKYSNKSIQKTIKEIAKNNKYISSSGDIWIYDMKSGKSSSEHFN